MNCNSKQGMNGNIHTNNFFSSIQRDIKKLVEFYTISKVSINSRI